MNSESQQWWEYHLRTARGESLTEDEQAIYDAGIEQFDQEEAEELGLGHRFVQTVAEKH